ncbi:MAG: ASCH domain-containing protein [Clostridia bacterium]
MIRWSFDDDKLLKLVLNGKKKATSSVYNNNLPTLGEESIITKNNKDICKIKIVGYKLFKFKEAREEDILKEGDTYEALAQNLGGYVLVEEPEAKTGIMEREDIVKTFKYKKISSGLVVKYVDKMTGELLDIVTYDGNEKDVINLEEKWFKYYVVYSRPDFTQIELKVELQEVIYCCVRSSEVPATGDINILFMSGVLILSTIEAMHILKKEKFKNSK